MARLTVLACVALLTLTACAERYKLRAVRSDEAPILTAASSALLASTGYRARNCKIAAAINDVQDRALDLRPASSSEYCFALYATRGVLDVPPAELRALFAHDLAHLQLGHQTTTGRRVSTRLGAGTVTEGKQAHIYTAEEETDADRYAARLLNGVAPGGPACQALGDLLERVGAESARWSEWTDQHPLAATRAVAAREFCKRER
jgi:hypothetical protein